MPASVVVIISSLGDEDDYHYAGGHLDAFKDGMILKALGLALTRENFDNLNYMFFELSGDERSVLEHFSAINAAFDARFESLGL